MRAIRLAGGSRRVDSVPPYGEASSATPASGTREERRGAGVDRDQEGARREQAARVDWRRALTGEMRISSKSLHAGDGHRLESPQFHQPLGPVEAGYPRPRIQLIRRFPSPYAGASSALCCPAKVECRPRRPSGSNVDSMSGTADNHNDSLPFYSIGPKYFLIDRSFLRFRKLSAVGVG
jgi:hypothetical protein